MAPRDHLAATAHPLGQTLMNVTELGAGIATAASSYAGISL